MRKVYLFDMGLLVLAGTVAAVLNDEPVHPAKLSKADIEGYVFDRPDMVEFTENGNTKLHETSLLSSDKQFASGIDKSGAEAVAIIGNETVNESATE